MGLFACFKKPHEPCEASPAKAESPPRKNAKSVPELNTEKAIDGDSSSLDNDSSNAEEVVPNIMQTPRPDALGVPLSPGRSPAKPLVDLAAVAAAMRPFTDESSDAPVHKYLLTMGKMGAGLQDTVNTFPDVGRIFGAAYRLNKMSLASIVNGDNTAMLAGLGQDVVCALDLAGRRNALSPMVLEGFLKQLQDACDMADVYGKDGWLLHMAFNDNIKGGFDRLHNAVVEALEAAGWEVPGKPLPLPRGAYLDANRNLRRCLKRIGGGSVSHGLRMAAGQTSIDADVQELASQMAVSVEAVAKELAALPADVPLDVYYNRMVVRQPKGANTAVALYKHVFERYDKECRGYLDRDNLQAVLGDLGALDALRPTEVEAAVARAFSLADQDGDGRINLEEFGRYYDTLACSDARKKLRMSLGPHVEEELKEIFEVFSSFGTRQVVHEMDSAHFAKLFKDCNLLCKDLTLTDIDLAFTRAKLKGSRKLNFDSFITALAECAVRKGVTLEEMVGEVLACHGPVARATKVDSVRLHDDKSTYTGVYAKGGPKVNNNIPDLASMLDRSDGGAAGGKRPSLRGPRQSITVIEKPADKAQPPQQPPMAIGVHGPANSSWKRRSTVGGQVTISKPLYEMWLMWAQFGNGGLACSVPVNTRPEMGVAQFIKMMRETGLLDRTFTTVQAELVFLRARPKGSTKLSFEAFEKALQPIAETKGVAVEAVERAILKSQGPQLTSRT